MKITPILCAITLGTFTSLSIVQADERVALEELPETVTKAVEAKFPGSKIVKAKKDTEDGKQVYELKLKSNDDKKYEVEVSSDGEILKSEQKDYDKKDKKNHKKDKSDKKD